MREERGAKQFELVLKALSHCVSVKSLLMVHEKSFARIAKADQILLRLKNPPAALKGPSAMLSGKFPFSVSERLQTQGADYGEIVFFFQKRGSAPPRAFTSAIAEALAGCLCRIKQREGLQKAKSEWDSIFDSLPGPVFVINESGAVLKANSACGRLEKGLFKKDILKELAKHGAQSPFNESFFYKTEKGSSVQAKLSSFVILNRRFFVVMPSSASQEEEPQASLMDKENELGFIRASIAHELSGPLTGIKALLHIIERKGIARHAPDKARKLKAAVERASCGLLKSSVKEREL